MTDLASRLCRVPALGTGLVFALLTAEAEIVYENSSSAGGQPEYFPAIVEYGDEIRLDGIGRKVIQFRTEYFGDVGPTNTATARVRFYANDGPGRYPAPGTLLFASDPFPLNQGYSGITFADLAVTVPDVFTWTIEFNGLTGAIGSEAGLLINDPPWAGFSYNDFWMRTGAGWALFQLDPSTKANFVARVIAEDILAVRMEKPLRQSDGRIGMELVGLVGRTCVVQASSDLANWSAIGLFVFGRNREGFVDSDAGRFERRFYRALTTLGGPMHLAGPVTLTNGQSRIEMTGPERFTFVLQTSRDFENWTPVLTNTFGTRPTVFTNATDPGARFYRTRLVP
jgi:hypothetical protein